LGKSLALSGGQKRGEKKGYWQDRLDLRKNGLNHRKRGTT